MIEKKVAIDICGVIKRVDDDNGFYKVNQKIYYGEVVGVTSKHVEFTDSFMDLLAGCQVPSEGEIYYEKEKLSLYGQTPEYVGVYITEIGFIEEYTGFRNLKYIAGMNGLIGEEEIIAAMKEVGITPTNISKVSRYSNRMIQKLGIAQAIMEKQKVLLLGGELFRTSNKENHLQLRKLLIRLKKKGYTMVIASEEEDYIMKLCTRIIKIQANEEAKNCSL